MIYNIIEVANTHGGDHTYMVDLISEFSKYQGEFGIKFQPSKPECIAVPDYEYFEVYKDFYFDEKEWEKFIKLAVSTKDVWLDLFDTYSIRILENNFKDIRGIKLQASVLNNLEVVDRLSELDLSSIDLIMNISGYEIEYLKNLVNRFENRLNPRELLLEIGFQAYPTTLQDSGYCKIDALKEQFKHRIVFADHIDGKMPMAKYFPAMAALHGVDFIEKHVRLDRETKYDHFSSLTPIDYHDYIQILNQLFNLQNQPFINEKEKKYLSDSLMKPITSHDLEKGINLDLRTDLKFRRSGKEGLDIIEITKKLSSFDIISRDVKKESTLTQHDFKRANIATIIACRLKSTRLKSKALENIGNLTSIEYCIKNCLRFPHVNQTILATSTLDSDLPLKDYTYSPDVHFFQGDPIDVIDRYLKVIDELKIDVFVRVTGDNPFVDAEICDILLKSHFENGADYTTAKSAAVGANLEIINSSALRKVKKHFPKADYSEYMSSYFTNNPGHFKINQIDLPEEFVRDYRLTLDYPEDLKLYRKIDEKLSEVHNDFGLREIISLLDQSELSQINHHLTQKYHTDHDLIETIKRNTRID